MRDSLGVELIGLVAVRHSSLELAMQFIEGDGNVVEVYVGRLRRKLASRTDLGIETIRGMGYRLSGRAR